MQSCQIWTNINNNININITYKHVLYKAKISLFVCLLEKNASADACRN